MRRCSVSIALANMLTIRIHSPLMLYKHMLSALMHPLHGSSSEGFCQAVLVRALCLKLSVHYTAHCVLVTSSTTDQTRQLREDTTKNNLFT